MSEISSTVDWINWEIKLSANSLEFGMNETNQFVIYH